MTCTKQRTANTGLPKVWLDGSTIGSFANSGSGSGWTSVFLFAMCDEKHKEIPTHRHNFYEILLIEDGSRNKGNEYDDY